MAEEQKSPQGRDEEKEQQDREEAQEVEGEEEEEEIEDEDNEDEDDDEEDDQEKRPSKVARLASDESGIVTTAVASPLGLGLGLGLGVGGEGGEERQGTKSAFTFMQMQEFHHQALIFKHMVEGIPVPIHLILPIWKSVAASYGPHHYPSFVGLGNLCYDFRNSMEPEPGRCRRTDGKKWRCSRDVVPEQKYCERHMHRGRNRSRKPVEAPSSSSAAAAAALHHHHNIISVEDSDQPLVSPAAATNANANANAVRVGLSPTSILSGTAACKTGAS